MLPCVYRVSRYNLIGCYYREIYLYLKERKEECMRDDVINLLFSKREYSFRNRIDKFRILILKFSFIELIIVLYDL